MLMAREPRLNLRPLQAKHAQQIVGQDSTLIAQPLGAGKTTLAVESVLRSETPFSVLIVAPRNTLYGWERTFRRQYQIYGTTPGDAADKMFRRIDSSKSGKEANVDLLAGVPGWYIVTWEFFARKLPGYWKLLNVGVIILDEVQRMQNRKSKTWAHVSGMGKDAKKIALSGTFNGNKLEGAWTTLRWLWPETLTPDGHFTVQPYMTPRSFWRWVGEWLKVETDALGFVSVGGEIYEPGTMLSYYPGYIRESDALDLGEVNRIIVDVDLSAKQRALYKQTIKEAVVWLNTPDPATGKKPLVIDLPITTRVRLRQITLGEPVIDDENTVTFTPDMVSSKFDAAYEIITTELEPGEPVLLLTHSAKYAVAVAEKFKNSGIDAWAWVGGTTQQQREAALVLWGMPNGIQVIVAVIEAIAEGIDGLQKIAHNEIWLSRSENMLMNTQAEARLHRHGQTKQVNRWELIAPGTLDEGILDGQVARLLELNKSLRGK